MKLYELTQNYNELVRMDDIDENVLADTLESITDAVEVKVSNIAKIVAGVNGDINTIDDEIKRLQDLKKQQKNKIDWLKNYVYINMKGLGINEIKGAINSVKIQKNPPAVEVFGEVPSEYKETRIEEVILKTKIKDDLKAGKELNFAKLSQGERVVFK